MAASIVLRGLCKSFGSTNVLAGIDLTIEPGSVFGYIGPNGSGKTTTVKILTGILGHYRGTVRVAGHDPAEEPLAVKRLIGYVPENASLYEALTASEFLGFVGRLHELPERVVADRSAGLMEALGLARRRHSRIGSLSKGMRQKLLLASALLHDPEILFLDEPLAGLDVESTVLVKETVRALADAERTVFYCSHMMDVVERVCDRIAILSGGRIVADGTFEELAAKGRGGSLERIFVELTASGEAEDRARAILDVLGRRPCATPSARGTTQRRPRRAAARA